MYYEFEVRLIKQFENGPVYQHTQMAKGLICSFVNKRGGGLGKSFSSSLKGLKIIHLFNNLKILKDRYQKEKQA